MDTKRWVWGSAVSAAAALSWLTLTAASDGKRDVPTLEVYQLRHADTDSVAKALRTVISQSRLDANEIKISEDERHNAIVVLAPSEVHKAIGKLLQQMDELRSQTEHPNRNADQWPSDDDIGRMGDLELRKLIARLSRQARNLQDRVTQLEKSTSFRTIPIPPATGEAR